MAHQFDTSVVVTFQYITLAFECRYHPALSSVIWHLVFPGDVIECFHYSFWFIFQYNLDCLYWEFIWSAGFSFSHLSHLLLYLI